jgi:hypothetical protein
LMQHVAFRKPIDRFGKAAPTFWVVSGSSWQVRQLRAFTTRTILPLLGHQGDSFPEIKTNVGLAPASGVQGRAAIDVFEPQRLGHSPCSSEPRIARSTFLPIARSPSG